MFACITSCNDIAAKCLHLVYTTPDVSHHVSNGKIQTSLALSSFATAHVSAGIEGLFDQKLRLQDCYSTCLLFVQTPASGIN